MYTWLNKFSTHTHTFTIMWFYIMSCTVNNNNLCQKVSINVQEHTIIQTAWAGCLLVNNTINNL